MIPKRAALTLAFSLAAMSATASTVAKTAPVDAPADCAMNYAMFEFAVPHLDLAACPASLEVGAGPAVFCRASIASDMLSVYAFEEEGYQCLRAMRSYEAPEFELTVQ